MLTSAVELKRLRERWSCTMASRRNPGKHRNPIWIWRSTIPRPILSNSTAQRRDRLRRQPLREVGTPPRPSLVQGRRPSAAHDEEVLVARQPQRSDIQYSGEPLQLLVGELDMLAVSAHNRVCVVCADLRRGPQ